ncbi:3-keto-disaccharide hydrolase [Flavobacterium faecale]|uniref:3-keto-disaccharide hydrolase n=1 Tax=Flavobacterium faecale TaxID=1355330 RepID=UPI003AAE10E7
MKLIFRLLSITLFFCYLAGNAQKKVSLFNQKDLKGWYAFEPKTGKHTDASEVFSVENNLIRLYGKEVGYLMSEESFQNFKLTVEFRWNTDPTFVKKTDKRNSGVMYLVPTETPDELWPKGIQFQIKDKATGDFVLLQEVTLNVNGTNTIPGRSVSSKFFIDKEKPVGEWNTLVVTVRNGCVTQKLNGKVVNKGTEATVKEGRILLQYEGYPIDFRKVIIKKFN